MSRQLGGYLRGVVINMTAIGALSGGGLALLGVPYPALLGVLAGLTETLPFIGPWIGGSPAVLIALLTLGPLKAGEVIVLYMVIQQIEGNTLVPFVMYRTVDLNPLTVIVAVIIGGALFGIVGAVLGVPLAVVIQVVVRDILVPAARRASQRVSPRPATPGRIRGEPDEQGMVQPQGSGHSTAPGVLDSKRE